MKFLFLLVGLLLPAQGDGFRAESDGLRAPPFKLHFHQKGLVFGNPMAVVYNEHDHHFHFYFTTSLEDWQAGEEDERWARGAVGHAVSPDLVNWEAHDPVVMPASGCTIDGGGVVVFHHEFYMYFGERCCKGSNCYTHVRRATSKNGQSWSVRPLPIKSTSPSEWVVPSVVYDNEHTRWVMVLQGSWGSSGDHSKDYQPRFYHSIDGIYNWLGGDRFVTPPYAGAPMAWKSFRPIHIIPIRYPDGWLMMGAREDGQSVYYTGDLDPYSSAFVAADGFHEPRGAPLLWDWCEVPFPVNGHPDHAYMAMAIMRLPPFSGTDYYQPLSLPVALAEAANHRVTSDWPQSVKNRIEISNSTNSEVLIEAKETVVLQPSAVDTDGTYAFTMEVELGTEADFTAAFVDITGALTVYSLTLVQTGSGIHIVHQGPGPSQTYHFPAAGNDQWRRVQVILDVAVSEVNIDGWSSRHRMQLQTAIAAGPLNVTNNHLAKAAKVRSGWTLDPVLAPSWQVPLPDAAFPRSAAAAIFATALALLL